MFTYICIRPGVFRQVPNGELLEFFRHLDRDVRLPDIVAKKPQIQKPPQHKHKKKNSNPHHTHFNGVGKAHENFKQVKAK